MFYSTLPKYFQQYKQNTYKSAERGEKADELYRIIPKNLKISLNKIRRQKYGRKYTVKQSRQHIFSNQDRTIPERSANNTQLEYQNRINKKHNKSTYSKDKNIIIKRHTHNTQNYLSTPLEREEIEQQICSHKNYAKINRSCNTTQEVYPTSKIPTHSKESSNFNEQYLPNFYRTQIEDEEYIILQSKSRNISMQNKSPIQQEKAYYKPTFVDLIKKFRFENLKTNINESLEALYSKQKYQKNEIKIYQPQKLAASQFFRQTHQGIQRKTANRLCKKAKQSNKHPSSKLSMKEPFSNNNSLILSPWGTVNDNFSTHQIQV